MKINGAWNKITRSLSVSYQVKLFAFNIATSCITFDFDFSSFWKVYRINFPRNNNYLHVTMYRYYHVMVIHGNPCLLLKGRGEQIIMQIHRTSINKVQYPEDFETTSPHLLQM